jgi:hypothetical protein
MKQGLLSCGLGLALLAGWEPAIAQDLAPEAPAKVLQIIREEIKAGRAAAHEKYEAGYVKAYKAAKRTPYLAMSALTGPSEAWFIVSFPSYAALEKETDATAKDATLSAELERLDEGDAAYRTGGRTMIAEYKPELSYHARGDFSGVHYVEVTIVHVRPGHSREYEELVSASRKGTRAGQRRRALRSVRDRLGHADGHVRRVCRTQLARRARFGSARPGVPRRGRRRGPREDAEADRRLRVSADRMVFQFSPRMSNPPAWLLRTDPVFWTPGESRSCGRRCPAPSRRTSQSYRLQAAGCRRLL